MDKITHIYISHQKAEWPAILQDFGRCLVALVHQHLLITATTTASQDGFRRNTRFHEDSGECHCSHIILHILHILHVGVDDFTLQTVQTAWEALVIGTLPASWRLLTFLKLGSPITAFKRPFKRKWSFPKSPESQNLRNVGRFHSPKPKAWRLA